MRRNESIKDVQRPGTKNIQLKRSYMTGSKLVSLQNQSSGFNNESEKIASSIQGKGYKAKTHYPSDALQHKENKTGLPDNLKGGIENLSGVSIDDVNVHYNSSKPADLNALAFAQGNEIYVSAGQEHQLPHEAWHVVQQKQGRVKPTIQTRGAQINDNIRLEQEADLMGAKAFNLGDGKG